MCTLSVSNVIYHIFSHSAAFYTLNGKNVNVMLELLIIACLFTIHLLNILYMGIRLKVQGKSQEAVEFEEDKELPSVVKEWKLKCTGYYDDPNGSFSFPYFFTILNSEFRIINSEFRFPKFALRISEFGIVKYILCG